MSGNSSGNVKTISPSRFKEGIFGFFRKAGENGQTAGPIETRLCAIYSDGSGNGHRLKNIGPVRHQGKHFNPRLTGAILEVLGGQHLIEILDMICRKKLLCTKIKFIN